MQEPDDGDKLWNSTPVSGKTCYVRAVSDVATPPTSTPTSQYKHASDKVNFHRVVRSEKEEKKTDAVGVTAKQSPYSAPLQRAANSNSLGL